MLKILKAVILYDCHLALLSNIHPFKNGVHSSLQGHENNLKMQHIFVKVFSKHLRHVIHLSSHYNLNVPHQIQIWYDHFVLRLSR
jgi:hypothetical protein